MIREAAVAGQFYPARAGELEKTVEGFCTPCVKNKAKAVICPHAGYIYSGSVAGAVYASIEVPDTVILLGPNHTGLGARAAVMTSGIWEIPTGELAIDEDLARDVLRSSELFTGDNRAHLAEHSLEVQLPFLYHLNNAVKIVPVTLMGSFYEEALQMGEALAGVLSGREEDVLLVVSSDMNHYESEAATREKDKMAIERVLALDAEGLLDVTAAKNISMCGVFPAAVAIIAMKRLGATSAVLVEYATSGAVSHDMEHVVGYAGFTIS